jgi:hypothetical protein
MRRSSDPVRLLGLALTGAGAFSAAVALAGVAEALARLAALALG